VADRLQLVDELRVGEELGHRAERQTPEVAVEAGGDDANAAVSELEGGRYDRELEELHLVDTDDVESLGAGDQLGDRRYGDGPHTGTGVADDVARVVAIVDSRLEDDDPLSCDLRSPQPSDHFLALPAEHRPADDLEPAATLWWDPDHVARDPRSPAGRTVRGGVRMVSNR
jgi:hypothetical protein